MANGHRKSGWRWLATALVLFMVVWATEEYRDYRNRPEQLARKFQERILTAGEMAGREVKWLSGNFDTAKRVPAAIRSYTGDGPDSPGIFHLVFRGDSLVYWDDNRVLPCPEMIGQDTGRHFACHQENGWYGLVAARKGSFRYLAGYPIRLEYPFQNEYLQNSYAPFFNLPAAVLPVVGNGSRPVKAVDGSYLFSLSFDGFSPDPDATAGWLLILWLAGTAALFRFLYLITGLPFRLADRPGLRIVVFGLAMAGIRAVQCFAGFPRGLYASQLFSPAFYSSSAFLPSLGDYALNAVAAVAFSLAVRTLPATGANGGRRFNALRGTAWLVLLLAIFRGVASLVEDLVMNSAVSLNMQNISGLTPASGYGIFIIVSLVVSCYLLAERFMEAFFRIPGSRAVQALQAAAAVAAWVVLLAITGLGPDLPALGFALGFAALSWFSAISREPDTSPRKAFLRVLFFALFATVLLNRSYSGKEAEKVALLATRLASGHNPVTEVLFEQVERKILSDTVVAQLVARAGNAESGAGDSLAAYLMKECFGDYWKKYQVQVTVCDSLNTLRIQPRGEIVNCSGYFAGIVRDYGEKTMYHNLWFLDYGLGREFYLAMLSFPGRMSTRSGIPVIYVELSQRNAYPDPGYPGLLVDRSRVDMPDLSGYSYAIYQDGRLVRAVGSDVFNTVTDRYPGLEKELKPFTDRNMVYYPYRISDSGLLLISREEKGLLVLVSPFPYLFLILLAVSLAAPALSWLSDRKPHAGMSLKNRLLFSLTGILVLTMLAVGVVQVMHIRRIHEKKNAGNLREKAYSVLVEAQHRYGTLAGLNLLTDTEVEDFLVKLSNVFFTDINLYDHSGFLKASSRPQIFDEGLLSDRMNPAAFARLVREKNSLVIQDERIGQMDYNSAYLPLFNDRSGLLGFVNLPYFTGEDESKREISDFLVTFINVYILLVLVGMTVIVMISNYITAPLSILAAKLSRLRLGGANEKIPWRHADEIGQLVSEYNRMIDELGKSAEKLARSERESAWREMARQVAHEIKNPLTPMKLSAQYLEKAWKEQAPDWDQRLARFTGTLVEQIDALSQIASDFSDFARMPAVSFARVDLAEVIETVISMYRGGSEIGFQFEGDPGQVEVMGDRAQLVRLFTNLFNNAVQSMDNNRKGQVIIRLKREGEFLRATVADNGCGIPPERAGKVFLPEFTTKAGGMGLGLAIVKGIVDAMNGRISFTSAVGEGTTFTIHFPAHEQPS